MKAKKKLRVVYDQVVEAEALLQCGLEDMKELDLQNAKEGIDRAVVKLGSLRHWLENPNKPDDEWYVENITHSCSKLG